MIALDTNVFVQVFVEDPGYPPQANTLLSGRYSSQPAKRKPWISTSAWLEAHSLGRSSR